MTSMLDRFRIDGQVAVITGSGRGIGAACALAFADAGADVVLSARSLAELRRPQPGCAHAGAARWWCPAT